MEVQTILAPNTDTETVKRRIAFQKSFSQEVSDTVQTVNRLSSFVK